jgi:hypothetical protein
MIMNKKMRVIFRLSIFIFLLLGLELRDLCLLGRYLPLDLCFQVSLRYFHSIQCIQIKCTPFTTPLHMLFHSSKNNFKSFIALFSYMCRKYFDHIHPFTISFHPSPSHHWYPPQAELVLHSCSSFFFF